MPAFGDGDACSAVFLALILAAVGSRMVEGRDGLRRWGWRLAAAAFIASLADGAFRADPPDEATWVGIALRGLLAAALTLGLAWVILAALAFVGHLAVVRPVAALRRWATRARLRRAERRRIAAEAGPAVEPAPPPPPEPGPSLRSSVDRARSEYEATCDALRSAGLDEAELQAALHFARQTYLRRIHGALKP